MNKIGIIGAMEEEVAILKDKMTEVSVLERAGMEFFSGKLSGHEVVVVRSGIGKSMRVSAHRFWQINLKWKQLLTQVLQVL